MDIFRLIGNQAVHTGTIVDADNPETMQKLSGLPELGQASPHRTHARATRVRAGQPAFGTTTTTPISHYL
jgi:hypothetical protein